MSVSSSHPLRRVRARKLVIVSCGALGTPPVLERSGIGNPEILGRASDSLIADVPGVGYEYQDHNLLVYPYKSCLTPEETLDVITSGRSNPYKKQREIVRRMEIYRGEVPAGHPPF